jgi:hypothetical protein
VFLLNSRLALTLSDESGLTPFSLVVYPPRLPLHCGSLNLPTAAPVCVYAGSQGPVGDGSGQCVPPHPHRGHEDEISFPEEEGYWLVWRLSLVAIRGGGAPVPPSCDADGRRPQPCCFAGFHGLSDV